MSLVGGNTVPASGALLDTGFTQDRTLIAVKYPGLASRLLHRGSSSLHQLVVSHGRSTSGVGLVNKRVCSTAHPSPVAFRSS
jgi:hypothetical protein